MLRALHWRWSTFNDRESRRVKRRRTQNERSEETRERLLNGALKILSKKGYAGFRLAEVSNVAGVSRGGLIHHYPSKEILVAGVLEYIFGRLRRRAVRQMGTAANVRSVLAAIVDSAREYFFSSEFPIYLDLVLAAREGGPLSQAARRLARRHRKWIQDFWTASLEASGFDRSTSQDVVVLIWSTLRGLAVTSIAPVDVEDRERIICLLSEILRRHLAGTLGAGRMSALGARER
jgi:AcrR family transcriptional regulator